MTNRDYLAYYLEKWRLDAHKSCDEVAAALSLDPQSLLSWEDGSSSPPLEIIVELAQFCQISQEEIIEVLLKYNKQRIYQALAASSQS